VHLQHKQNSFIWIPTRNRFNIVKKERIKIKLLFVTLIDLFFVKICSLFSVYNHDTVQLTNKTTGMKTLMYIFTLIALPGILCGCSKKEVTYTPSTEGNMEVIISNTPFKTDEFLRIPYTLKTWEWKKSGLSLRQINVLDDNTKTVLATFNSGQFMRIYQDPLPYNTMMQFDKLYNYYLSIQLPVPLDKTPPARISHRFVFRDTVQNKDVTVDGGAFVPKYNETPLAISSPVKGTNWMFFNQSTNEYHFYMIVFLGGKLGLGERFAFDNMQVNGTYDRFYDGDPTKNEDYFCYRDTLFAVADGTVVACSDTMTENDGNTHNHLNFKAPIDYAGNHVILNIGNGRFAMYAHCVKGSVLVKPGDQVSEGQPIALLGNSGNSDAPHLHFEIGDAPDFFMCNGIPFVLKKFTKIGEWQDITPITPVTYHNSMNEQMNVIRFD